MKLEDILKIKAHIVDGEALQKIPWENVNDYLSKSGWTKLREVKYGSVWKYNHPVKDKKYDQLIDVVINLPKTDYIADYSLRMHEVLVALELTTNKSQLEIYVGLIDGDLGEP